MYFLSHHRAGSPTRWLATDFPLEGARLRRSSSPLLFLIDNGSQPLQPQVAVLLRPQRSPSRRRQLLQLLALPFQLSLLLRLGAHFSRLARLLHLSPHRRHQQHLSLAKLHSQESLRQRLSSSRSRLGHHLAWTLRRPSSSPSPARNPRVRGARVERHEQLGG